MFLGQVQSSNKMISHCFPGPFPRILRLSCDPYAAAILSGRGVTWYFDSLQHVGMKTITSGVKNGPCETLPTFDDVHLVLRIPYMLVCAGKSQLCRYKMVQDFRKTDVKLMVGSWYPQRNHNMNCLMKVWSQHLGKWGKETIVCG